eukprot:scaffold84951_cov72-Phaeocystis_antarctica.AAC.4
MPSQLDCGASSFRSQPGASWMALNISASGGAATASMILSTWEQSSSRSWSRVFEKRYGQKSCVPLLYTVDSYLDRWIELVSRGVFRDDVRDAAVAEVYPRLVDVEEGLRAARTVIGSARLLEQVRVACWRRGRQIVGADAVQHADGGQPLEQQGPVERGHLVRALAMLELAVSRGQHVHR